MSRIGHADDFRRSQGTNLCYNQPRATRAVSAPAAPNTLPEQVWLRFVDGRPVSGITTQYLAWCCDKLEKIGKQALLLVWDNASWHTSKVAAAWTLTRT